jgi:UDP-N-acetylmuramate dehydrogenase
VILSLPWEQAISGNKGKCWSKFWKDDVIPDKFHIRGTLLRDEPMSRHTSLKVGGPADLYAIPEDAEDLQSFVHQLGDQSIPWFVIGGGYNLLIRDGGFRGVAISLKKLNHLESTHTGVIRVEAGVRNIDLSRLAEAYGLTGIEFLVGIPGTVGGAVRMNAGAHGGEIFDHITFVDMLVDGRIQQYTKKTLSYGYRCLQLDPNKIIIAADFLLAAGTQEMISAAMDLCIQKRHDAQKVRFPNAGSFFKNPSGHAAWKLIDEAGLRGLTVGGAQVSEVHTNFLVNRANATAADFLKLAAIIKERVFKTSAILLEEEVRIMGED